MPKSAIAWRARSCTAHPCSGQPSFHKRDVRITAGIDHLRFFNSERLTYERILPCKVSCGRCGTPIADEGRRMWLAFPSLFDFGQLSKVPAAFKPTCHI
ncbi:MAG: hypothetical protein V2J65_25230, partial [Desulfobacteraceae bacterium]|nr:hypothetical protein [Desulfobacteraceae bacterium]